MFWFGARARLMAAGRPNHAAGMGADSMPNDDPTATGQRNTPLRGGVRRRRGAASFNNVLPSLQPQVLPHFPIPPP